MRLVATSLAVVLISLMSSCRGHAPAGSGVRRASAIPVEELTLAEAQQRLSNGVLTSRALTQTYLDRISAIDAAGPELHAVLELNPDALRDADALDVERHAGKVRGPLHGIPVLVKDNIDIAGMVTSAGSLALVDNRAAADAFLVARLRAAGAVILGKTNLSEWANFRSSYSISGWSSRGLQTRNPYVLDRSPCGSSAGTASAIAASLAVVGVGTETDGSIICPSAMNGVVGMKPTVGLVSRGGIIPISASQDTAGPMGRTVADVAALLGVLAGVDERDPACAAAAGKIPADYVAALRPDALRGKRLGVLRQAMHYLPVVDEAAERGFAAMRAAGAELVDVELKTWRAWEGPEFTVLEYEFKDGLNGYLRGSRSARRSLEDLIAWNRAHADVAMPLFGQDIFEQAQALGPLTDAAYLQARDDARRLAGKDGLLAALEANHLDAIVAPATGPASRLDTVAGDHFLGFGAAVAAVAGTPSITVPMGEARGLPLGMVFLGRPWSEADLLGIAYAFEQATHARKPPTYVPTIER